MDATRWAALEAAFETARALDGDARERWLAARAADDPALVAEVRALLTADEGPGPLDALGGRLTPVRDVLAGDGPPAAGHPPLPARVGPYVVAGEIGRGGMGVVCRAHDPRLGRDVALKVFAHAAGGAAADLERRVIAEARAASALDHPHICTIHDVGTLDDGRPYLAMAYYAGGTLAERLAGGALPVRDAAAVAVQLADALACAHAAGIVHRDVKPRNVAFGDRGEAKLLDFGVALLHGRGGARGSAGTPAYMAPEQVRGAPVDARADVWALGVVLFEMLCGRRPFVGGDRADVLRAIVHDAAPDVRALRRDVPPPLARVAAVALAKEPAARWADGGAMAGALRAALAPPAPGRARARRARRVAAGALLLAAGAAAAALTRADRAGADRAGPAGDLLERARARFESRTGEGVEEAVELARLALARDPARAPAHALLSRAYVDGWSEGGRREGEVEWLDSAVAHAREAAALAPRGADGWSALGNAEAVRGRHAEAVAAYRLALDADPRHAPTMLDLAASHAALGRHEEWAHWTERALAIDPDVPGGRQRAAGHYRSFGLLDEARRHIAEGHRRSPTDNLLRWELVQLRLAEGDTAGARRDFAAVLRLLPAPEAPRLRAWFEALRGDARAARPWVDRALAAGGAAYDVRLFGAVYAAVGERARADSLLRPELRRLAAELRGGRGALLDARFNLAWVHAALGDREAALAELERLDASGPLLSPRRAALPGWESVRDDPRFRAAVERSELRRAGVRARVRAQLAGMRADGP